MPTNFTEGFNLFLVILCILLALLVFLCLIRAVKGPTVADRIVAANMMGTLVMTIIAILAVRLGEGYLMDICIIYACLSFLAVIVLSKVMPNKKEQEEENV